MHILCTERHCYQNVFKTKDLKFTQKKSFRAYRQYSKKSEILFNENGWDFLDWNGGALPKNISKQAEGLV